MSPSDRSLARFRVIGLIEGVSFLLLMGIAMPLKYWANLPMAVRYVGWIHGLLFIAYVAVLGQTTAVRLWSPVKALLLFVAAVVPFGTFVADRWLRREQAQGPSE